MECRCAVIVTSNQSLSNGEDQVLQYLSSQLTELNINLKDTCIVLNDDKNFIEFIEKWEKHCDLILYSGNQQYICNILSKFYDVSLVGNYRLAQNVGESEHIKLANGSEIYEIQNPANGTNHILIRYLTHIILPIDLSAVKAIMDNLVRPYFCQEIIIERFEKHLYFNCNQDDFDAELDQLIHNANQSVNVRRYFAIRKGRCELNVVLISSNFNDLTCSVKKIKQIIPHNVVKQVASGLFWDDVDSLNHRDYVKEARRVIADCLFKYKPEHVFISFNGGKDCTVLLYLTVQLLRIKHPLHEEPLLSLYIQSPNPFSEVEAFIEKCRQYYNLNVVTINSSVKKGLCTLLTEQPHFKACLMGTRKTDPYSQHLTHFQMTDFGWPQIMRVNPLLNWTYSQIWNFLLSCEAPYCELYDQGYTSLGSRTNTIPNPSLKTIDEVTSVEKYLPAYKLQNGADERSGRL